MELKSLLKELEIAEQKMDAIDKAWEEDYENEALEEQWNAAYKAENEAFNEVVNEIVRLTSGMINEKTASMMLRAKRDELVGLVVRIA